MRLCMALWLSILTFLALPAAATSQTVTRFRLSLPPGQRLVMGNARTPYDISPDGRYIAYVATDGADDDPRRARAFLRPLDAFEVTPIPASAGARVVFFSADSQQLAFHRLGGGLWRTSVSGGTPVKIGDTVPLVSGAWGPDDTIVFTSRAIRTRLWRMSAEGGDPEELATRDGHDFHNAPQFLPDGRHLLVSAPGEQGSLIEILSLGSGESHEIFRRGFAAKARYLANGQLLIVEGGSLLAAAMDPDRPEAVGQPSTVLEGIQGPLETVAVSDTGTLVYLAAMPTATRIVRIERHERAEPSARAQREVKPSREARSRAASRSEPVEWRASPREERGRVANEGGVPAALMKETSWTITGLSARSPIRLSPDGQRLAVSLVGASGLKRDIAVYDLTRGTLSQLSSTGQNRSPVWSPDGLHVAFQSNRDGIDGIFVAPADGTGDARPVLLREAGESRVYPTNWTPDGQAIVYRDIVEGGGDYWQISRDGGEPRPIVSSSFDEFGLHFSADGRFVTFASNESGQYQIYVQEFPDGRKWPVTTDGGLSPVWVGQEIFYRSAETMMVVVVETNPFSASAPKALFERPNVVSYDVSRDGQRFFLTEEPREPRTELHVIQNWFQELESNSQDVAEEACDTR